MTQKISRRTFLQSTSAPTAAVLAVGFKSGRTLAAMQDGPAEFTPFVRIGDDGTITAGIKHFECGQVNATGLAKMIAEELNHPLDRWDIEFAAADASR